MHCNNATFFVSISMHEWLDCWGYMMNSCSTLLLYPFELSLFING